MNEGLTPCPELVRLNKYHHKTNFSFGASENVENFNINCCHPRAGETYILHCYAVIQNSLRTICDMPVVHLKNFFKSHPSPLANCSAVQSCLASTFNYACPNTFICSGPMLTNLCTHFGDFPDHTKCFMSQPPPVLALQQVCQPAQREICCTMLHNLRKEEQFCSSGLWQPESITDFLQHLTALCLSFPMGRG